MARTTPKRIIYLDLATDDEIRQLAKAHRRTQSQQTLWLLERGLTLAHLLRGKSSPQVEDCGERRDIYPVAAFAKRLDAVNARLNRAIASDRGATRWTFSATCRGLLSLGLTVERWIHTRLAEAAATGQLGAETGPSAYAVHLVATHTADELAAVQATHTTLERWQITTSQHAAAVAAAIGARTALEALGATDA